MHKFWFYNWIYWALHLTLFSMMLSTLLSSLITLLHYLSSSASLNSDTISALGNIFNFYFAFTWSFSFVLGLLLSVKKLFVRCFDGERFELLSCDAKQIIEKISLFEQSKLFRKWMIAIIWSVAAQMVFISVLSYLFFNGSFSWFNHYSLYVMVLISGAVVLPLLSSRCKMIRLKSC